MSTKMMSMESRLIRSDLYVMETSLTQEATRTFPHPLLVLGHEYYRETKIPAMLPLEFAHHHQDHLKPETAA